MNQQQEALKILFAQYQNSQNLIAFLNAFVTVGQDIEDQANTLLNEFSLTRNINGLVKHDQYLDAAGEIVGLPRFSIPLDDQFFQFDVTPLDEGYKFADGAGTNFSIIENFRFVRALSAWAVTMNSLGSTNDLILSLALLWGVLLEEITITETLTSVAINVNAQLFFADISLYNYITPSGSHLWPKIAGISYSLTHL